MTTQTTRAGFSLVDVLVALILFEVGLMSVLGLTSAATRLSDSALRLEGALTVGESVADSLLSVGYSGPGSRITPFGVVRWSPSSEAPVEILVTPIGSLDGEPGDTVPLLRLLVDPTWAGSGGPG